MPRRVTGATLALALALLASGCGFVNALAHPASASDVGPQPAPASSAASSPSSSPIAAVTAELAGSFDGRPATLRVAVAATRRGIPPDLVPGDCRLAPDAAEYAEVSVVFTDRSLPAKQTGVSSNLRLDLNVAGGAGAGVLVIGSEPTTYCNDTSVLPATNTLQTQDLADEHQTITVFVVARTSAANPDPLRGVTVQLRNPRHRPDDVDSRAWAWDLQQTTGSACPADTTGLCVRIG
jgi:hypothetical protein